MGLRSTKFLVALSLILLFPSISHPAAIQGLEEGSAVGYCKSINFAGGSQTLTTSGLDCVLTSTAPSSDSPVFTTKITTPWVYTSGNSLKLSEASGSSAVLDQSGFHIQTIKGLYLGTTRWDDGSDKIDGDQIANDTIDDDSIDFGTGADQVSGIDIPLDATNFDTNLSGTDTNVQAALETLDELASGGDMTQAVYDTDTNNVVDSVDAVLASIIDWTGYTGDIEAGTISLSLSAGYSSSARFYEDPSNGSNYVEVKAPASIADSSTQYLPVVSGTLINDKGATMTGNIDLGGATYLEIPNGTGPTCDDPGEICHDTTDNQLVYDDYILSYKRQSSVTILAPAEGDSAQMYSFPDATTVTNFKCIVAGSGTSVPYTLYECTNPTTCTIVKAQFTCGTGGVSFTSFGDASIAAGSSLFIGGAAPTGSPTAAFLTADFKIDRE